MAELLSTSTVDHLLVRVTTSLHVSDNQFALTKASSSLIHTDCDTIRVAILGDLRGLIAPEIKSSPTIPVNHSNTFFFESLLTVDKSTSGRPVKSLFSFSLRVHQKLTGCEQQQLSFATIPVDPPSDSPSSPVLIHGTITLAPQSPYTTTVTLTASMEVSQSVPRNRMGNPSQRNSQVTRTAPGTSSAARKASATGPVEMSQQNAAVVLDHVTGAVLSLHTRYARYEAVDAAIHSKFVTETVPNAPPVQPQENDLIDKSLLFGDDSTTLTKFKRIKVSKSEKRVAKTWSAPA